MDLRRNAWRADHRKGSCLLHFRTVGRLWGQMRNSVTEGDGRPADDWMLRETHSSHSGLPINVTAMFPQSTRGLLPTAPEWADFPPGRRNDPVLDDWTPDNTCESSQPQSPGLHGNAAQDTRIRPSRNFPSPKTIVWQREGIANFGPEFLTLGTIPTSAHCTPGSSAKPQVISPECG